MRIRYDFDIPDCPICGDQFDSREKLPIRLDCIHNICRDCTIDRIRYLFHNNSISCPICHQQARARFGQYVVGYTINRSLWMAIRRVLNDTTDTLVVLRNLRAMVPPRQAIVIFSPRFLQAYNIPNYHNNFGHQVPVHVREFREDIPRN